MAGAQRNPSRRRIKLGVVANEFFDLSLGKMSGFGWAARQLARLFRAEPELGVELVFLSRKRDEKAPGELAVHETRLIPRRKQRLDYARRVRSERIDLLLCIDYRPGYRGLLRLLPRTPMLVWARDPRTPQDLARIATLRIPGQEDTRPQGITSIDCTSLAGVVRASRWVRRPVLFATPAASLAEKIPAAYGVDPPRVALLPNPLEPDPGEPEKSVQPTVVFLGRRDPIKRPWLFVELARRFPQARFLLLGQAHVRGAGAWQPQTLPANVQLLGHVDGEQKRRILAPAWVLVNTSIHEGLAVSFLEALACEVPLLACVDPERVVSRFGICAGRVDADGLAALPSLERGLGRLLDNGALRAQLGREGRRWVCETHTRERFSVAFGEILRRARLR